MAHTLKTSSGYTYTVSTVAINAAKNDTRELVAAVAGKQIWVLGMVAGTNAAGTVTIRDSTTAGRSGAIPLVVAGAQLIVLPAVTHPDYAWIKCGTATALQAVLSVNTDLDGILVYATVTV